MDVLKYALFAVVALFPLVILKKHSAEQAMLLTVAVAAVILCRCISEAAPLLESLEELFLRAGIESVYISILLRTIAASLVSHLCADLCRDGGSQTLATLVEIAGTVSCFIISLPVLEAVAELLLGYFG